MASHHPDRSSPQALAPDVVGELEVDPCCTQASEPGRNSGQVHRLNPAIADRDAVALDDEDVCGLGHAPVDVQRLRQRATINEVALA